MKITIKNLVLLSFLGISFCGSAQTEEQRAKITKDYDKVRLSQMEEKFRADALRDKEEALRLAKVNNWKVSFTDEDGAYSELMRVNFDGTPVYYKASNSGSAITSRVNLINSGGAMGLNLNGQGMIVGEWDAGPVRATHQDFGSRVILKDGVIFDEPSDGSDHATHVAGTMIGSGSGNANAKGMAYQGTLWANTWTNDQSEMVSQASQGLLVSNHSYGLNLDFSQLYYFGAYMAESKDYDDIMRAAPYYQIVVAAGNDRQNFQEYNPTKAGRDMLTGTSTSKNAIVVAAVNQVNTYVNGLSVSVGDFSNWGPTDDGRVKPDISTKGVGVFSTTNVSNTSYGNKQGTSMAAPGIAGSLILLQQHYNNLNDSFMRSATLRALVANSADEAGTGQNFPGPDHKYGFGLMNAARAAQTISDRNEGSLIEELSLSQGQTYTRIVTGTGLEAVKATIAWTDLSGNINSGTVDSPTPSLVNDLDIRVTKLTTVYYPWRLNMSFIQGGAKRDGDNNVDNIEKLEVPTIEGGLYTITVTHKGSIVGGSQPFSLVVTGIDEQLATTEFSSSALQLYPNPAADNFQITISESVSDITKVEVYDMLGKLISSKEISSAILEDYQFDISNFVDGIYVVKISQGDQVGIRKLVKK
ncbi:MAG TPA: S8 family serine peptidase [Flavobacterium sp.]